MTQLHVIVTAADGTTTRWGPEDLNPATIPQGITFRTQRMGGFADASLSLSRRIDGENVDVRLLDRIELVDSDGTTIYDGYVQALPRSLNTDHVLGVQAAGWVGHASDTTLTDIIVDRDLSSWGEASIAQRIALFTAGFNPDGANLTVAPDATGTPGLVSSRSGPLNKPINRFVYDAGPTARIGKLTVGSQTLGTLSAADANLSVYGLFWSDDNGGDQLSTGDVKTLTTITADISSTPRRFAVMDWRYDATGGSGGIDYTVRWQNVAVHGAHGLTPFGTPEGYAASDVIKYIARTHAPLLKTTATSIQTTTYPIPQLAWKSPTSPWEAMLACNAFHLWNLAVWEDRTLHFSPPDFTDYDWEIRTDEPGTTLELQGQSADDLINGVRVQYTNVATGETDVLDPAVYAELRDSSVENDATRAGRSMVKSYDVTSPTTLDAALQIGRAALAEFNAPKQPGSISKQFTIRDRAGHEQPVWKVRAGDRVVITSSAAYSDRPRMISETSYDHGNRTVTLGIDSAIPRLEGIAHRQQVALAAAGLG